MECSFIDVSALSGQFSNAVDPIINPISNMDYAVWVVIDTVTVLAIVAPASFKAFSVFEVSAALALHLIFVPLSFIGFIAVREGYLAMTVSLIRVPIS